MVDPTVNGVYAEVCMLEYESNSKKQKLTC